MTISNIGLYLPERRIQEQIHEEPTLLNDIFNPISRSPGPQGGIKGPDAKNQGKHQSTEMKVCMSLYVRKSLPNAKFQSSRDSIFGDRTSDKISL